MAEKATKKKKSKSESKKGQVLVILESPTKANHVEHFLGAGYKALPCVGHLIDLPKSRIAIDVEHGFKPEYITVRGKAKILKELQKEAKNASLVLLASDPDREGEAIAWHLNNALKDKTQAEIRRVTFSAITPAVVKESIKYPRDIDENMVNAQKARRILDRLVGYNLSPLLWKKVKNGLSAGRVQSVALMLICQREEEVEKFIPEEYWTLEGDFIKGKTKFTAQLLKYKGVKPELKKEAEVNAIIDEIKNSKIVVTDIKETEKTVRPKAPFTTSKLQQTAANKLGFTSRKTMQIAQQLYEGLKIGSTNVGLITYMRTDSVRISESAIEDVRSWIGEHFPEDLPAEKNEYDVEKRAQDAHEAIRPTYVKYTPDSIKEYLTTDQFKLYSIIWEQFVSSQMNNAKTTSISADIQAGDALFRSTASKLTYKGFYNVIKTLGAKDEVIGKLPSLKVGEELTSEDFYPEQHFTQGPARYNDASMVKTLEDNGIGRPATFSAIIDTLSDRYYITRVNKQLVPTLLGKMVCKILVESFPSIMNVEFTSKVEDDLDKIAKNEVVWNEMLKEYFFPFKKHVDELMSTLESYKGTLDEPTDQICDKCGKPMMKKLGRFGYFLACSGFPECHNTKSVPLAKCPCKDCNGDIVERKAKGRGKSFFGCTNYPSCNFISHFKPIDTNCPKCGWFMVEKFDKKNGNYKSCINPDCDYLHSVENEDK